MVFKVKGLLTQLARPEGIHFSFGSTFPFRGAFDSRPESGAQPKQVTRKLTFALERPKLEVFSP